MQDFTGQIAFVTGAASGIGRALSEGLAERGATVVATDIDVSGLQSLAGSGNVEVAQLDVTDAEEVRRQIDSAKERHGRLDLMCNNAGVGVVGEMRDLALEDWRHLLDVNLHGVIHGIHAAYPIMAEQGHGHILNTASGYGLVPGPLLGPYVTSKHGVVGLSLALRAEGEALGVGVSVLCPGFIQTGIFVSTRYVGVDGEAMRTKIPVRPTPARVCAEAALAGMRRNRAVITTPFYARVLWWLQRAHPDLLAPMRRRQLRDFRRIRKADDSPTR